MKYMCRTCKKECDDVPKHLMTVHKSVESQLQTNPKSYDNSFEKLK